MTIANSPYQAFATLLTSSGHNVSPAELHGLLLGRSCAGAGFNADEWLIDAAELLESEPQDNIRNALIGLQEMVKGELTGDDVTVVLLLPTDDAPLAERAAALGEWCQGFLSGFGLNCRDSSMLSTEATEVLRIWPPFPRCKMPWKSPKTARPTTWKSWSTCASRRCCCSRKPKKPTCRQPPSRRCINREPGKAICP